MMDVGVVASEATSRTRRDDEVAQMSRLFPSRDTSGGGSLR